jgi:hypothetical protein
MEKVNHPSHYGGDYTYEAIKVIDAWDLNFNAGNALKYISRYKKKGNPIEDIKKAICYLNMELNKLEHETKNTELPHEVATGTSNDVRTSKFDAGEVDNAAQELLIRYSFVSTRLFT